MKALGTVFGLILILCVGGFIYLSVVDVPVNQTQVTKNIPNTGVQG
jgi:hypothetical protein